MYSGETGIALGLVHLNEQISGNCYIQIKHVKLLCPSKRGLELVSPFETNNVECYLGTVISSSSGKSQQLSMDLLYPYRTVVLQLVQERQVTEWESVNVELVYPQETTIVIAELVKPNGTVALLWGY